MTTMKTKIIFSFCFVLIILLSIISGCSEDNPVTNPGQNDSIVGTLVSTPNGITVNSNDTVLFRFTVNPGIHFTDTVAHLIKSVNNVNTEIGLLKDNGDLLNGDEIINDNVYSGKLILNESAAGDIIYKAIGYITSTSNGYSQPVTITVYTQLSSQDISILYTTQANARNQLIAYLGGNPNNIENAASQLAAWLQTQPGVQSVERNGNTGILINYTSGISGGILFSLADANGHISTLGGEQVSDSLRRNGKSTPLSEQTRGTNDYFKENINTGFENMLLDANTIGNRNVLIYEPYLAIYPGYNIGQKVTTRLAQSVCKDYNITSFVNQEANIAVLSTITNYGLVFITSHGLLGKRLFTGEIADTNLQIYKTTYRQMIKADKLSIWKNLVISVVGTVSTSADVYVAEPKFFSELTGTFPNSVIVNNSCESAMNPDLGNAFIGKGAKTYFGYSKVVHVGFVETISDSIAKRLAVEGKTTGNTFFNSTDPETPNAVFTKIVGNDNLAFTTTLQNKDFEAGTIEGWTRAGDGRVISRLGSVNPRQGTFMGIISTGLGYTTSSGSISQCFTVQNNQSTLKLKWNFLSEEFLEYIGSQFQDFFQIKIIKQDGSEVILFRKSIDNIASMFGATQQNPGQLIRVSPEIVFDRNDVYMTGWQDDLSFDVTPYRNQIITIVFSAGDVGDSIFDTAILLDDIVVQ